MFFLDLLLADLYVRIADLLFFYLKKLPLHPVGNSRVCPSVNRTWKRAGNFEFRYMRLLPESGLFSGTLPLSKTKQTKFQRLCTFLYNDHHGCAVNQKGFDWKLEIQVVNIPHETREIKKGKKNHVILPCQTLQCLNLGHFHHRKVNTTQRRKIQRLETIFSYPDPQIYNILKSYFKIPWIQCFQAKYNFYCWK